MKNIYIISIIALAFFVSCEEDVSIKADFEEQYVLNCILSADTNFQIAYLSKSFDVDGYNGNVYSGDPFIKNAEIVLYVGNHVHFFREAELDSLPGFDFNFPITYYYLDNFQPTPRSDIFIKAILPNGIELSASQRAVEYRFTYLPFFRSAIPPVDTSIHDLRFTSYNIYEPFYYIPKMVIPYENTVDGQGIKITEVPLDYIIRNNERKAVYPGIMKNVDFSYKREILNLVMNEISEGDNLKSKFKVYDTRMSMLILNDDLAAYYSAENYVNDNFSVVVSKPEYSNIDGGRGIFGSYSNVTGKVALTTDFVRSFGYQKGQ